MNKLLLFSLACTMLPTTVFGQGKIALANDSHPIYFATATSVLLAPDRGKAGQVLPYGDPADPMPSGKLIRFGLYGGTSSTTLSFLTSVPVNDGNESDLGVIGPYNYTLPSGFPGGVPALFQVKLWDAPYALYEAQMAAGTADYSGLSTIFTLVPGPSAFASIDSGAATTWAPAHMVISVVPEPCTLALIGFGLAAAGLFRRCKQTQ
jgi:hypothetical protein